MKTLYITTLWKTLLGLTAALALTGCAQHGQPPADTPTTVHLLLSTRSTGEGQDGTPDTEAEVIHTLRILVTQMTGGSAKVERTFFRRFDADGEKQVQATLMDLSEGDKKLYVIANEEAIGLQETDFPGEGEILENGTPDYMTATTGFPTLTAATAALGIPLSSEVSLSVSRNMKEQIPISLIRTVAKIVCTVRNTSSAALHLSGFRLGKFLADRTYLFPKENLPEGVTYHTYEGATDRSVPPGGTETVEAFSCLLFETQDFAGEDSPFTLELLTDGGPELPAQTIRMGTATRLARNTCLNLTATVNKESGSLNLTASVADWDTGSESDIAYGATFDGMLTLTSANPRTGTSGDGEKEAYAVCYGNGKATDRNAGFILNITGPKGGYWTANVSNGKDFRVTRNDGSAAGGYIDGKPVYLTVRPLNAAQTGTVNSTLLYINLMEGSENKGKQVINSENVHPGDPMNVRITQVTPAEWDRLTDTTDTGK